MSAKTVNEVKDSQKHNQHNQYYIHINRFILFYTFIGVTYLLFLKSVPNCGCQLVNNISTDKISTTNKVALTKRNISMNNIPMNNIPMTNIPMTSYSGSKRNLLTTNTTIRSVKRNYELIQNLYTMLPDGIVIIWHGLIADIPDGWALCDGTNGTPDLQDKFIIGGGNLYNLGNIGGSTTTILSTNQLPKHQHGITNIASTTHSGHTHNTGTYSLANNGAHTHTFGTTTISTVNDHSHGCSTSYSNAGSHSHTCNTGYSNAGSHTHSGTTSTVGCHDHANGEYGHVLRSNCGDTNDGHDSTCGEPDILRSAWMTCQGSHSHTFGTSSDGSHHHSTTCSIVDTGLHNHGTTCATGNAGSHTHSIGGTTDTSVTHSHSISGSSGDAGSHSHTSSGITDATGNGNSINILNPYYTAYYIMKIPYKFPTDNPTLSPTLAPSEAPTITPSNAPTLNPSKSPSNAPSTNPSISPTITPSLSPTLTPTSPPSLAPSKAPTNSPTLAPAVEPTISPTLFPTYSPTNAPSKIPSIAPSFAPTIAPSLAPTIAPTTPPSLAPSLAPSIAPSLAPSLSPTVSPSLAPSVAPSLAPSISPTVSPSLAPSDMPTPICWAAKFKTAIIKSNNLNRNDVLYSGEQLVSSNCRFLLTMNENGNLILSGLVGKYEDPFEKDENGVFTNNKNKMRIYNGWETNTTMENNSGESTAVMMLKDGTLIIEEHEFIGVPEFEPIVLWQSGESIEENELILELTDNGCLTLNEYYGSINTDHLIPFWFVCAQLESSRNDNVKPDDIIDDIQPSTTIETTILTTIKNNNNEENEIFGLNIGNNKDNIQLLTIWNVIISIILILILLICLYFCIKQMYNNYQSNDVANYNISSRISTHMVKSESNWEMANQHNNNDDDEGDDDDIDEQMKQAIELWSMETNNVTTIMQQTSI